MPGIQSSAQIPFFVQRNDANSIRRGNKKISFQPNILLVLAPKGYYKIPSSVDSESDTTVSWNTL
jgi:hypothetical protein